MEQHAKQFESFLFSKKGKEILNLPIDNKTEAIASIELNNRYKEVYLLTTDNTILRKEIYSDNKLIKISPVIYLDSSS